MTSSILCFLYRKKTSFSFVITQSIFCLFLLLPNTVFAVDMPSEESQWKVRLTPVALSFTNRATITGIGFAKVELRAGKLIVDGSFEGLQGAATTANIHIGPKAIPGPAVLELLVLKDGDGKQGKITANVELNQEQLAALANESLYIQLHSEVAKDGNLRGWILPTDNN